MSNNNEDETLNTSQGPKKTNEAKSIGANILFVLMIIIILVGGFLYITASYGISLEATPSQTSNSTFQILTSDNQSITGTLQIQNSDNPTGHSANSSGFSIFDLAIVSGILGGFALTMVFARRGPEYLQASLLFQAFFYVLATIAFIVFGFYLAADKARLLENFKILVPIYVISCYGGFFSLGIGMSFTLWALIRLTVTYWNSLKRLFNQAIQGD